MSEGQAEKGCRLAWQERDGCVALMLGDLLLLDTSRGPLARVARGHSDVEMFRGNFRISDSPSDVTALESARLHGERLLLAADRASEPLLELQITDRPGADGALELQTLAAGFDRIWLQVEGEAGEHYWGGGEQMS